MVSVADRVLLLLLVEIAVLLDASLGESSASSSSTGLVNDGLVIGESVIFASSAVVNASFVKTFTVGSPESEANVTAVELLYIGIPGRVFVSYVDYESAGSLVNSSTLAGINVYSDSSELVGLVAVYSDSWNRTLGTELYLSMRNTSDDGAVNGSLLVEVAVFRRNQLRSVIDITENVSVEIIVEDGVANSRTESPELTVDLSGLRYYEDRFYINVRGSTTLYFLSPTTKLNMYDLTAASCDESNVYIEADDIDTYAMFLSNINKGKIVAFFNSIRLYSVTLSAIDTGTVCLVVRDTFEMDQHNSLANEDKVALPGQTGGLRATGKFSCAKAQIPDRVPRDITLTTTVLTPSNETSSSDTDTSARSSSESSSQSSSNPASTTKPMPVVMLVVGIALTMVW